MYIFVPKESTMKIKYTLLVFGLVIGLSGCEKDEDDDNGNGGSGTSASVSERLTGNNWVINSYMVDPAWDCNGDMVTEIFPACFDECDQDDIMELNADMTYLLREGELHCEPGSEEVYESGDWSLNSDETIITFGPGTPDAYFYTIVSVSASQLVLREVYEENGVTHTSTITYD